MPPPITPLPSAGPLLIVSLTGAPPRVTVVVNLISYARSGENENCFVATSPESSRYSNDSVAGPLSTLSDGTLDLNIESRSAALTAGSSVPSVKGRTAFGTAVGTSSSGWPALSRYFFSRQLLRVPPRVLKTAVTAGFSKTMSCSFSAATVARGSSTGAATRAGSPGAGAVDGAEAAGPAEAAGFGGF